MVFKLAFLPILALRALNRKGKGKPASIHKDKPVRGSAIRLLAKPTVDVSADVRSALESAVTCTMEGRREAYGRFRSVIREVPTEAAEAIVSHLESCRDGYSDNDAYVAGCLTEAIALASKGTPSDGSMALDACRRLPHLKQTRAISILTGAGQMKSGDVRAAYSTFLKAVSIEEPYPWFGQHRGVLNLRPFTTEPKWLGQKIRIKEMRSPVVWLDKPNVRPMTVLFCADKRYFCKFAGEVLQTIIDVGSVAPVHFHVINADDECLQKMDDLRKLYENVTFSTEEYPFKDDLTYFATVRFARAMEFMQVLGPLYISDIDNKFIKRPENAIRYYKEFDAGFRNNFWQDWLPWSSPAAGSVFLNATPEGFRIAQLMSNYVDHRFKPNSKHNWYFDQVLLYETAAVSDAKKFNLEKNYRISGSRPLAETQLMKIGRKTVTLLVPWLVTCEAWIDTLSAFVLS